MRTITRFLAVLLVSAAPLFAGADGLPARFSLGKYVPGDWWMYMHSVRNPEREWLKKEWSEVWEALGKTGIDKDILSLVFSALDDAQRAKTEAMITKVKGLLDGVNWGDLTAQELVFAERIAPPLPEYALLTRGAEGSGAKNAPALAAILQFIASFDGGKMQVTSEKRENIDVWVLRIQNVPYSLHLFRRDDVIGLVTNQNTFDVVVGLMEGKSTKPAIVDSPRFRETLKEIKAPEDSLMFFDFKLLLADLDAYVDYGFAQAGKNEDERKGLTLIKTALSLCNVLDVQMMTTETETRQEFTHTYCKMQPDKMGTPLAKIFHNRKPFDRFDKFIPAEATGFSIDTFLDLELVYHTVLDFIEKNIPDGAKEIAEFKSGIAEFGFDFDRDLFSWWSGEMISVDLPAAVGTPMGGADSVTMIRVKNAPLASQKLGDGVNWLKTMMQDQWKQTLLVNANPNGLEGFTEITHPALAMFFRPVIGVRDEWLMIGTSTHAVNKCLDVAADKGPSILKNQRFQSEGLIPKGKVTSASFSDTSNFAQELGQGLGMASMYGGMMTTFIPLEPNNPDAKKGKEIMQKAFGILAKLSPVVAKIDFYSSESSVGVSDGPVSRSESVVTYKASEGNQKTAKAKD